MKRKTILLFRLKEKLRRSKTKNIKMNLIKLEKKSYRILKSNMKKLKRKC